MTQIKITLTIFSIRVQYHKSKTALIKRYIDQYLTEYNYQRKVNGKPTLVREFAFFRNETRGPAMYCNRNLYDSLAAYLDGMKEPFELEEDLDVYKPPKITVKLRPPFKPRDIQKKVMGEMAKDYLRGNYLPELVETQTGKGKPHPVYQTLPMWNGGVKRMGDIMIGDEIIGAQGQKGTVLNKSDQGILPVMAFTLSNGTVANAAPEHLWPTYTNPRGEVTIRTSKEISELMDDNQKVYLPLSGGWLGGDDGDVKIHPMVLAAYFKTGYVRRDNSYVCIRAERREELEEITPYIDASGDEWVIVHVTKYNKPHYVMSIRSSKKFYKSVTFTELLKLDMARSYKRLCLPIEIRNASYEYRKAFINKVFSTVKGNSMTYGTSNLTKFKHLRKMALSVGYNLHIRRRKTPAEIVYVMYIDKSFKDKIKITGYNKVKDAHCQCIEVDTVDSLYVLDNYIVTHNTAISFFSTVKDQYKTLLVLKATHAQQWVDKIPEWTTIEPDEILYIKGLANLKKCFEEGYGDKYKYFIISSETLGSFYRDKLKDRPKIKESMAVMIKRCGIGAIHIDEIHEMMATHYYLLCDSPPVARYLAMSASFLDIGNRFISKMMGVMFPAHKRFGGGDLDIYVDHTVIYYDFELPKGHIKCSYYGMTSYNQKAYEASILRHSRAKVMFGYLIIRIVEGWYIRTRKTPDHKVLIYTETVEMCEYINYRLKQVPKYTNYVIVMYTGDKGSMAETKAADMTVATIGKASTSLDVPGLITVVDPTLTGSGKRLIQKLGRLRKIEDIPLNYVLLVNSSLDKHLKFLETITTLLKPRCKKWNVFKFAWPKDGDLNNHIPK